MGYWVKITSSNLVINECEKPAIFQAWCDLNDSKYDGQKSGGQYANGGKTKSWYSWMDADYDKICKTVEDILDMLGFEYSGNLKIDGYDSKTGQEDIFFRELAKHIETPAIIGWEGEDGDRYYWAFANKKIENFSTKKEANDFVREAKLILKEKSKLESKVQKASKKSVQKV